MKKALFTLLFLPLIGFSQSEKYPVFEACKGKDAKDLEDCFNTQVKNYFFIKFEEPEIIQEDNYKAIVKAVFRVSKQGKFRLMYINSPYKELRGEVDRVLKSFPQITPALYNNHVVEMQYILPITFPTPVDFEETKELDIIVTSEKPKQDLVLIVDKSQAADSVFLEHNSQLNIPFTHQRYVDYEFALHKAAGTHTASKPYLYSEINEYLDLSLEKTQFLKLEKKSWFSRKLWNEHLLEVSDESYWITMDLLFDVQLGKDNSDLSYTYNNTRLLNFNGGLGNKFSFSATIYESQGRFASYVNNFISNPSATFRPAFSEGLVPGRGKAKGFGEDAYDYPVAEGYLSYTPNANFQFQFGNGKNFIGDGYRSFLLSDVASPSTYLKMEVNLWKFQYTNLWLWASDVRHPVLVNGTEHARKYVAIHYLSINITDRLNLGLFETAISSGEDGLDAGFLNPLIFYRSVEFGRGEDAGNAMIGLTAKYKLWENVSLYSQFLADEFSVGNLNDLGDWKNKFALQLGAKVFNAFAIDHLFLQAEFNVARPYTFSHKTPLLNYAHYSQPLAHLWGANFWEFVGIARYKKGRWSGSSKLIYGKKGLDFTDGTESYGGNVYQSYQDRIADTGHELAQGNTATIFNIDLQGNYLLNPSNRLSLFGGLSYRNFSIKEETVFSSTGSMFWVSVGVKADLFNWYLDF
jgi:hypothetical protein